MIVIHAAHCFTMGTVGKPLVVECVSLRCSGVRRMIFLLLNEAIGSRVIIQLSHLPSYPGRTGGWTGERVATLLKPAK